MSLYKFILLGVEGALPSQREWPHVKASTVKYGPSSGWTCCSLGKYAASDLQEGGAGGQREVGARVE